MAFFAAASKMVAFLLAILLLVRCLLLADVISNARNFRFLVFTLPILSRTLVHSVWVRNGRDMQRVS